MHPIHIMPYDIALIQENIALEIITGGALTANATISVINFDTNVYVHVPLTLYQFTFIIFLQIWQ